MKNSLVFRILVFTFLSQAAQAEDIGCITTTWKLIGSNHKICVQAFDDPKVQGVSCHISQAKTGGIAGAFGVAEDPSQFSIACRQIGPIIINEKLPQEETAFTEGTSLFFKETKVSRMFDEKRNTLIYVAISRKLIEGAPANSISTVPIMPWVTK
ncbi:MAG: CreA family protein [Methylococcales bacterium]|jgi:CreA protein|nr:CreA family protein [Methylococcales bacterium]